jgi:hypothetical protein
MESSERAVTSELQVLVLVDRDAVDFLAAGRGRGLCFATVRPTSGPGCRAMETKAEVMKRACRVGAMPADWRLAAHEK